MRLKNLLATLCLAKLGWCFALCWMMAMPVFGQEELLEEVPILQEEEDEEWQPENREVVELSEPRKPPLPAEKADLRPIDAEKWEQATQNLDYSADRPELSKPKKEVEKQPETHSAPNWNPNWAFLGKLAQVFAIIVAVVLLGYLLYRYSEQPSDRQIAADGTPITFENVEEYLHESDLDRFLRQSLEKRDFSMAVRLYFLKSIRQLSEQGHIAWSKEKTNRMYLRDLQNHSQVADFQVLVRGYEKIWFGNTPVSEEDFQNWEERFLQFLNAIKS